MKRPLNLNKRPLPATSLLLLSLLFSSQATSAFLSPSTRRQSRGVGGAFSVTATRYQSNPAVVVPVMEQTEFSIYDQTLFSAAGMNGLHGNHRPLPVDDPALVEFVSTDAYYLEQQAAQYSTAELQQLESGNNNSNDSPNKKNNIAVHYPFAAMMQGSAPYIAAHAGRVAVFHLPGDLILDQTSKKQRAAVDNLFSDMALAWLLGIKLVIVVGCRYEQDGSCEYNPDAAVPMVPMSSHECHNALRVTDKAAMRRVEEEAGFLRVEVERKLNRLLRLHHGGVSSSSQNTLDGQEGNVMSGNFYTAKRFGTIRGQDFEYTGVVSSVHKDNIQTVLDNNDVVLLTTAGFSPAGDLVNVNGYHLAASVATALQASKLIYMATQGSILQKVSAAGSGSTDDDAPTLIQELPLSFSQAIADYHAVQVHGKTGFATFEQARQQLPPRAVELLLHLAWASWAVDQGVSRAHIVNPADGALLEELFTSKNGINTCIYHDDEHAVPEDDITQEDWDSFFAAAQQQQ